MESAYCMGIPNLSHSVMPAYVMQDNTQCTTCVCTTGWHANTYIATQSTVHCGVVYCSIVCTYIIGQGRGYSAFIYNVAS